MTNAARIVPHYVYKNGAPQKEEKNDAPAAIHIKFSPSGGVHKALCVTAVSLHLHKQTSIGDV